MNTFLSLLAVIVFALVVFLGGEHTPARTQVQTASNTQLAQATPDNKRVYTEKSNAKALKKKKSPNDDFRHLNN